MKSNLLNFGKAVSVLFAAVLLLLSPVAQSATGGSYSSSTGLSTIYTKGIWYPSYFTVLGSPPASGKITTVYYNWSYATRPVGFVVQLCHSIAGCLDVTNIQNGSTQAFAGASPSGQFFLRAGVSGTGTMSPDYGNTGQVIVNYTY